LIDWSDGITSGGSTHARTYRPVPAEAAPFGTRDRAADAGVGGRHGQPRRGSTSSAVSGRPIRAPHLSSSRAIAPTAAATPAAMSGSSRAGRGITSTLVAECPYPKLNTGPGRGYVIDRDAPDLVQDAASAIYREGAALDGVSIPGEETGVDG
jgi:hypothetical protein